MSEIRVDKISEKTADAGITLKSQGTADNKPMVLTLQTAETDMAANDVIGKIAFQAPDEGTGTDAILVAAAIQARSEGDFSSSANATAIDFMVGASEAAATKMSLSSGGVLTAVELDISGNIDVDGTTNLDVVDIDGAVDMASTLQVDGVITTSDGMIITTADNTDTLSLISTDADAAQGPNLRLYRNSGSPADNDVLGMIDFEGRNDNSQDVIYVQMESLLADASDGTEDGYLNLSVMLAGTLRSRIEMDPGETVINEASQDLNFRVESNGKTHAIFVDAGNDHVNINTSDDLGGDLNVDGGIVVQNGSNLDQLSLISTDADANQGPNIRMYRNSSSPADDDTLGVVEFEGRNSASQDVIYSQIRTLSADVTDGEEDGTMDIKVMNAGSLNLVASFKGPETVINDASIDHDFRVESDGRTHAFFVDAGTNTTMIGTSETDFHANADDLIIGTGSGHKGLTIFTGNDSTGNLNFADGTLSAGNSDRGFIKYDHNTDDMFFSVNGNGSAYSLVLHDGGQLSTGGETAPDTGDGGLCLDQNANDINIISFKSSDIAHGTTGTAETDTFAFFRKHSATEGGISLTALSEAAETIKLNANPTTVLTDQNASTVGTHTIGVSKKNGTGSGSTDATSNLLSIANHTNTRFHFRGDGNFYADAGSNTFDEFEDAHLVRAYDLSHGRGVINSKFDKFVSYNHEKLAELDLVGRESDGTPNHFVSVTGFQRLHNGAIWQQYEKTQKLTQAMYKLAIKTLGKEEADKLLDEEEIKLLN